MQNAPSGSAPFILFLRHAERMEIPEGDTGETTPLTRRGESDAFDFGCQLYSLIGERASSRLKAASSPVGRCEKTARLALKGARSDKKPEQHDIFASGYIRDMERVNRHLATMGYDALIRTFVGAKSMEGLYDLAEGSERLALALRRCAKDSPLICVSHDVVILPFVAHYLPERAEALLGGGWLGYLEGCVILPSGEVRAIAKDGLGQAMSGLV